MKPKRILSTGIAVRTNLIPRETFPGDQLTEQEKKEYKRLGDELDGHAFFRFKGQVYAFSDFVRVEHGGPLFNAGWTGQRCLSAHHAIVMATVNDTVFDVVVGEIFS